MKILFVTAEAQPFVSAGSLGEFAAALPKALRKRFVGCRVVLPLYKTISDRFHGELRFVTSFSVPVSWRRQYCGVFEIRRDSLTYLFLDNCYYFRREGLFGHPDDAERFAFFSRAVLEMSFHTDYMPDVIHCNDWQTAAVPLYLKTMYGHISRFAGIKTLFDVRDARRRGIFPADFADAVFGLPPESRPLWMTSGALSLTKAAAECADAAVFPGRAYAALALNPDLSPETYEIFKNALPKIRTVTEAADPLPQAPFSAENPEEKERFAAAFRNEAGLTAEGPLFAFVGRLTEDKGAEYAAALAERVAAADFPPACLAVAGAGDTQFEKALAAAAEKAPEKIRYFPEADADLQGRLLAAADFCLAPGRAEPSDPEYKAGMRGGALPVVRGEPAPKDGVEDGINGLVFTAGLPGFFESAQRAVRIFADPALRLEMRKNALNTDFSWNRTAGEYLRIYREVAAEDPADRAV